MNEVEKAAVGRESGAVGRESGAVGRESGAVGRESGAVGREYGAVGRESGGLSIPPVNPELREQEKLTLYGGDVTVSFYLPDGETFKMKAKTGTEIKKVKVQLGKQINIDPEAMELIYENRILIDPISLVDGWGPNPKHHDIHVRLRD